MVSQCSMTKNTQTICEKADPTPNNLYPISSPRTYDCIISGMGCAGLSLAVHMIRSGAFTEKKILLIDREEKTLNDRTWCFWETGKGLFEDVVCKKWEKVWFHANGYSDLKNLSPYAYKMIRGKDYYKYCLDIIQAHPNVEILYADIQRIGNSGSNAFVEAGGIIYSAAYVFNSILFHPPVISPKKHHLLQHFKGWIIETQDDRFKTNEATLMDFRPSQKHGTTFVYVMPLSPRRALVEYTLFSPELLQDDGYDEGLKKYIEQQLGISEYVVHEQEFGVIPMTNHRFRERDGRIIHMGTAGGQTKPSSGYTFRFIQKQSARIVQSFLQHGHPFDLKVVGKQRFDWYDSVLLNILSNRTLDGWFVFRQLFKNNHPCRILKFLDNETGIIEEMKLMYSLPQWPFMKAGFRELFI